MLQITIEGVALFDGVYDLDLDTSLNGRELHVIKQVSGVRLGEIDTALAAGDYDLIIAFAVIALIRAGRAQPVQALRTADALLDAEAGKISIGDRPGEGDALPPPPAAPAPPPEKPIVDAET